ncbi:uncharacterized protein PAC_05804 [Phialocephala subalpina]|uniref:Uncharacterized protein n=1 Tax=Phialocephala subalpina TaxID=576137 RepID=A0A1L7WT38_9HELO|nr:uncharacterized protein PAC_05804 [Phialocephala subalpina]
MFSICSPIITVTLLPKIVLGYTTLAPSCSNLEQPAGFVGIPPTRCTFDILWSSIFTIFACTWTILHLNVPEQRDRRDPGWRGDMKWFWKGAWTKTKWMIPTMVAPELLLSFAMGNFAHAKEERDKLKGLIEQDGVPWSLTHSLFVDMGGFVLEAVKDQSEILERSDFADSKTSLPGRSPGRPSIFELESSSSAISTPTIVGEAGHQGGDGVIIPAAHTEENATTHTDRGEFSYFQLQGFAIGNEDTASTYAFQPSGRWSTASSSRRYHIRSHQLRILRSHGHLKRLPSITKEEINSISKGDSFSKAIASAQICWTILQVTVRVVRGLAISQLELATTAFSFCGILIYACSWNKPKDVQVPITIMTFPPRISSSLLQELEKTWVGDARVFAGDAQFDGLNEASNVSLQLQNNPGLQGSIVRNDICWVPPIRRDFKSRKPSLGELGNHLGLLLGGVLFGAVHILAWNFAFPSEIERTLWRAASVFGTAIPILISLGYLLLVFLQPEDSFSMSTVQSKVYVCCADLYGIGAFLLCVTYVVVRLFILLEIFRTLSFLPADAYVSTWASSFPHIA